MGKLYLIDGMSVVFRAYHAMSKSGLKSPTGETTSAVFAFANIITSLLEKEKPEHIAVVFDISAPTFRPIKYPLYKANRDAFPEELVPQLARIKEFLDYLSIQRIELPGFEADDIIGTLSKEASDEGVKVVCLTADKDYYQLVNDHVLLYKPARHSGEDFDIVGFQEVLVKFGVAPSKVIDVLALIGDSSDNVPGVKGIGEKTAIPLIQRYGSIESLYEQINSVEKDSVKSKLIEDKEKAFLAKWLVTIKCDVPLDVKYHELDWKTPRFTELESFFSNMGFNALRNKWHKKSVESSLKDLKSQPTNEISEDIPDDEPPAVTENKTKRLEDVPHDYRLVDTDEKLDKMLNELAGIKLLSVDLETSGLDKNSCRITGIALCAEEGKAYYVAVCEEFTIISNPYAAKQNAIQDSLFFEAPPQAEQIITEFKSLRDGYLPVYPVLDKLRVIFENPNIGKIGQNIKFDAYILKRYKIELSPLVFDSMLASYILNPDNMHNLDALSQLWLNYTPIPISLLIGEKKSQQKNMEDIPPEQISDYACEDADLAFKLRNAMMPSLQKENLLKLAEEIEFPLVEVLIRMEAYGVAIDTKSLSQISIMIEREAKVLTGQIYGEAGTEFNIDSPKQLGEVLFEKMQIPPLAKNKTGYSTNVQVLSQLAEIYPIAQMVLEYRQLVKIQSTYVEALPKLINPKTGRIHTSFNQTIASTGRLSSTDPNLQNIPIRTALGKEIRKAFVPQFDDRIILSADYSQIELRIMAHISEDPHLIDAFKNGLDIHSATAAILFDIPLEEVNLDMRRIAKTVNFGIMYGLGSFGLSQRLKMGRKEATEIISNYFLKYPGIKRYMDLTIESTREKGYAETLCGRRRYFLNINSRNHNLKTADERAAINMPIQGTASDMMKIAMIRIDKEMHQRKMKSMMTIQVHDELVFEAYPEEAEELTALVKHEMESALLLGEVPVIVETGTGANWYLAH